jgi:outer membrane protein assembly factor BamB
MRLRRFAIWVALASAAAVHAQGPAFDYTQWRGQNRDGSASAFSAPKSWPANLSRKWSVEIGEGYGTPLVFRGLVYVFTRRGGDEVLTALSIDTGRTLWHTAYPAPYTVNDAASQHGAGPKATPLIQGGRIFTMGISGIVAAFDLDSGRLLWKTAEPREWPVYGAASSPVAADGLVILHPGNYGPLTAFDERSGAVKWTAGDDGWFTSPMIATFDGVRQVLTVTAKAIIGVSLPDGRLLWSFPFRTGGATTPVVNGDTVIVGGLDSGFVSLKPVRQAGRWRVDKQWDTTRVSTFMSNPVVVSNTLFGLSERASGQFYALDAATGSVGWLSAGRQAENAAVVKAGDLLFLLKDDGELVVARADRAKFDVVKRYTVATSATWAQPAISGGRILIKDTRSLTLWTIE